VLNLVLLKMCGWQNRVSGVPKEANWATRLSESISLGTAPACDPKNHCISWVIPDFGYERKFSAPANELKGQPIAFKGIERLRRGNHSARNLLGGKSLDDDGISDVARNASILQAQLLNGVDFDASHVETIASEICLKRTTIVRMKTVQRIKNARGAVVTARRVCRRRCCSDTYSK